MGLQALLAGNVTCAINRRQRLGTQYERSPFWTVYSDYQTRMPGTLNGAVLRR